MKLMKDAAMNAMTYEPIVAALMWVVAIGLLWLLLLRIWDFAMSRRKHRKPPKRDASEELLR